MALHAVARSFEDPEIELDRLRARVAELEAWNLAAERATEALIRSEDALRKIFDHSNDGILVVDPAADRIVDANHRACLMLGHSQDSLLAASLSSLYPDDRATLDGYVREVLERGTGSTREVACRTASGERRATEISASTVELSNGAYLIALLRDVTERNQSEDALRAANQRMRADLEAAADMQRALLPHGPPAVDGLRAAWHVEPCERLGGDTLNLFAFDRERLGFFLLDVSGHGVKAAMLSVALQRVMCPFPMPGALLVTPPRNGTRAPRLVAPRRVASRLNRLFPMDADGGQYFTIVYGILDVPKRELHFVSAGQGAPIHVPRGGEPVAIERYDLPIGLLPDAEYRDHRVRLAPGSRVVFSSDGVHEAIGPNGEDFGRPRVMDNLRRHRHRSLQGGVLELVREIRDWSGDGLRDDVSLLALELA